VSVNISYFIIEIRKMISTPPRKFVSPKSSPSNESYFGTVSELTDDGCTDEELSKEDVSLRFWSCYCVR
jgi:hypothetical protein